MGVLLDILFPQLQQRFPGRGLVMVEGEFPYLRFPRIHKEVGDIEIHEHAEEFVVHYGNFTHVHYGHGEYFAPDQWEKKAIEQLISDLDLLFGDRLKMHGSHTGGGGIIREGDEDCCPRQPGDPPEYVWSGPLMGRLRDYEKKVISILTKDVLPPEVVDAVTTTGELVGYEYTGAGYFLTLRHSRLPSERIVCKEPMVLGKAGGIETGFVVFLQNNQLMLECHSWGDDAVPESYRDEDVEIVAA